MRKKCMHKILLLMCNSILIYTTKYIFGAGAWKCGPENREAGESPARSRHCDWMMFSLSHCEANVNQFLIMLIFMFDSWEGENKKIMLSWIVMKFINP